jgi:hypothetical protein
MLLRGVNIDVADNYFLMLCARFSLLDFIIDTAIMRRYFLNSEPLSFVRLPPNSGREAQMGIAQNRCEIGLSQMASELQS